MSDNDKPPICGGIDGERWLPVAGYEGLYEVSDRGRVKSLDRIDSRGWRRKGKILAGRGSTYPAVALPGPKGQISYRIHVLVLGAFIGPMPDECNAVRHLNDIKDDNRLENLEYGTTAENQMDAFRNGGRVIKTHCIRGHARFPLNEVRVGEYTACRACHRAGAWIRRNPRHADLRQKLSDLHFAGFQAGVKEGVSSRVLLGLDDDG